MLSITISITSIILTIYILRQCICDLSKSELDIYSCFQDYESDISESYTAIEKALENQQDIDK
ncbi:hypothetical protein Sulba_1070 [Sulfurospirillum barnesii SES-3]|uniref:Uncharacterized protein n=1 Tax=Sulfurospirillum barnesii (strain ATCC 700032 / DSM 10660 / SES-3) TaxID=760154 RepID=I3XWP3_SULBS|nr:hypothetical protein Sulba_1070 [Sulfurospirillum barnesii SES-3]